MTPGIPASKSWRKGYNSTVSIRAAEWRIKGSAKWESTSVSPCPGKCLATAITCWDCRPRMYCRVRLLTSSFFSPNDRMPMTGFLGLTLMSATGAKFT